jgi:hypothetical protein
MVGGKLEEGGHFGIDSFVECSDFSGNCCVCICGKMGQPWQNWPGPRCHYLRNAGSTAANE